MENNNSSSIQKAHKGNVTQDNKPIQTQINKTSQWLTLNQINNLEPKAEYSKSIEVLNRDRGNYS